MKTPHLWIPLVVVASATTLHSAHAGGVEPNLKVEKTVETSFDREWTWTIDKSSDVTELFLSPGPASVPYRVLVETSFSDSQHTVSGEISVHNPASVTATITDVTDMVSPDIPATVNCPVTFPYDLAPGGDLLCDYTASLPDGSDRDNTATVTTTGSVGGGEVTEPVEFGDPTNEIDECVTVTDDQADPSLLGYVCECTEFEYELSIGPYECGEHVFMNVATLETNDTGTTDDDDHTITITINVECPDTCTLTQGYWKTHSEYGPAPYDDTWALLPAGADTEFFGSGLSWYDIFWTPPQGDACIQLAHQWQAAFLNGLNGTDTTAIAAELALAETLLDPFDECPNEDQQVVGDLADVLADFNEGLIGPPHCSE